jgi:hypothetical protein
MLYEGSHRALYLGVTGATKLNAFAYASPSDMPLPFDFIGVNGGLVFTMIDVFARILAFPDLFPEIGNTSLEKAPPAIAYLPTDAIFSVNDPHWPACPVRQRFAQSLASMALTFFVMHEVTHLTNGHLDLKRSLHLGGEISEAAPEREMGFTPILSQTLEFDADLGGIELLLTHCFWIRQTLDSRIENGTSKEMATALRAIYSDAETMIGYAQLAAYICFRLFDVNWQSETQDRLSHPLYAVRLYWMARGALHLSSAFKRFGVDQARYYERNVVMIRTAEECCARLLGERPNYSMLASVNNSAEYTAYFNQLNAEWCRIRPILTSFHRSGRLRACTEPAPT